MPADTKSLSYTDPILFEKNRALLVKRAPRLRSVIDRGQSNYYVEKVGDQFFFKDGDGRQVLKYPERKYSTIIVSKFLSVIQGLDFGKRVEFVDADKEYWLDHLDSVVSATRGSFWKRKPNGKEATTLAIVDHTSTEGMLRLIDAFPELDTLVFFVHDVDLFMAALQVMDWTIIFGVCDSRKLDVWLHFAPPGNKGVSAVLDAVKKLAIMAPDNIVIYFHSNKRSYADLEYGVRRDFVSSTSGVGFFRDEIVMVENTMANLMDRMRPLIEPQRPNGMTAVVVGSGPSLDHAIEQVRTLSESCAVIACGTAVEPLLAHGIRVDVCVNQERGRALTDLYEGIAQRVELKPIPLVASTTVDPRLQDFFSDGYYYFRGGLNTSKGFGCGSASFLVGCDPTVTNAGLSLAGFLGFRRVILFGVDVGSIDKEKHHSETSAYYKDDNQKEKAHEPFKIPVPACFGGSAKTSVSFAWTRYHHEKLIAHRPEVMVVNASDGAMISGAPPVEAAAIPFLCDAFPLDRAPFKGIELSGTPFDDNNFNYDVSDLDEFVEDVRSALRAFSWADRSKALKSLTTLLWSMDTGHPFQLVLRGTLTLMVWSTVSTLGRMTSDERSQYEAPLRRAMLLGLDGMYREIRDLIVDGKHALDWEDPRR
jgi:hypothetical protein